MSIDPAEAERAHQVRLGDELPQEFRKRYWNQVKQTLQRVFQTKESLANELVGKTREKLKRLEEEKGPQTFFYHAGPLEIASDLTGRKPIGPPQKALYQELLEEWSSPEQLNDLEKVRREGHLDVSHPED